MTKSVDKRNSIEDLSRTTYGTEIDKHQQIWDSFFFPLIIFSNIYKQQFILIYLQQKKKTTLSSLSSTKKDIEVYVAFLVRSGGEWI